MADKSRELELIRPALGTKKEIYLCHKLYTKGLCHKYPDFIFVFGDNVYRSGKGGQAVIREMENSVGIRTKRAPTTFVHSYFYDKDFDSFKHYIDNDFDNLESLLHEHPLVFSSQGYGNGLAEMHIRAPTCYKYLCSKLNDFIGKPIFIYATNHPSILQVQERDDD